MTQVSRSRADWRIAIVQAQFNPSVTDLLLKGCRQALLEAGVSEENIEVLSAPGAYELPLACKWLAGQQRHEAIIALGAVVRGETAHFDFISAACAQGLMEVSLEAEIPVAFGVLTPENGEQAMERADPARRDKGREVAEAALAMIDFRTQVEA